MNEDFIDLLRLLLAAGARFMIVGAHAMAVHGVPRATGDMDIWLDPDPANAERAWPAILEFGFLGRSDLVRNKRASGRPKDLADLGLLER